jgi:hypothetical protein
MVYEIEFYDDNMASYVRVDAESEEAALFVAGMKFNEMALNPAHISIGAIKNLGSRI